MNKLFTKIATAFVGIAMAIGVGVAIGSNGDVRRANAADTTGQINFGSASGSLNVNASPVSGDDSQDNEWTVTTAGTTSFTPANDYAQIGSSKKPASSITFTTTLSSSQTIKSMSAKFGGFSGTAGTITLKVGDSTIGTGSLNATSDVTVTSTDATKSGTVLTVTVTGISKGVKAYYISYTYSSGSVSYSYSVTYNGNGNTGGTVPSQQTGTAASVTLSSTSLTKTGNRHIGWSTSDHLTNANPDYTLGQSVSLTGNLTVTLYAHWKQTFTVTYNGNGNTGGTVPTDSNSPYDKDSTVTVLGNTGSLVKTGNEFLGWKIGNAGDLLEAGDTFTISADSVLYAQWGVNPYTSVYSTGFESGEGFTARSTYNTTYTDEGPDGGKWDFYYGCASNGSPLVGSQSMQMRWYSASASNLGYARTKFAASKIKKISFKYMTKDANLDFIVQYNTSNSDSGWQDIETVDTADTSEHDYSKVLTSTINTFYFRVILTILGNTNPANKAEFRIDSVNFYQEASTDPTVVIDDTDTELSITEKENVPVEKTLVLSNVTMTELSYSYDNTKVSVSADNENSKLTITGLVVNANPYDVKIKKGDKVLYTIHFTVIVNNTVTITSASDSVQTGKTLQLSASSSKGDDTFTWSTSDAEIATVSESGLVTGVAVGSVTITATSVNWSTTSGTKELSVTFGGMYSRANWYNPENLEKDQAGTDATGEGIKSAFSGNDITISSASVDGTVKDGKYGGLSFGSSSKNGSITINMNSGYYLKSVTLWGSVVDSGTIPAISGSSAATLMSNHGAMVSRSQVMGDFPLTWTFASDSSYVTISGGGASNPKTRFTIYQLDLVFTNIAPSQISLGEDSSATLMRTETKTLLPTVMPRNYNVNLGMTWSTGDSEVATVSNGVVTAVGTGSTNITGTSTYGNVVCAVTVIPLTASSINIRGETITSLSGTGSEELDISGKTWDFTKTRQQSLDMTTGNVVDGYTKYSVKIGDGASSGGSIGNQDAYMFKFKKVIVAYCLNGDKETPYLGGEQTITVSGSDTYGGSDVSTTSGTTSGLIETFTLSTACTYISISTAGTRFVSSVTFVFDTPEETEFSVAEYILGLSPDRGSEVIGSCTLNNGTYIAAKRFLNAAGSDVIERFQTSSDPTVVRARERYSIWAKNNGDSAGLYDGTENFTASGFILLNNIKKTTNTSIIVIVTVGIAAIAIGGYFLLRKKKED